MEDAEKREQLIKGYEGQIRYLYRRIERNKSRMKTHRRVKRDPRKDIEHCRDLIVKWQKRIDACKNGDPLDFLGKKL